MVSCDLLLRAVVGALRARGQVQESPNMAPFDVDAWLGAVFGEGMGCKLQDRQQRFLKRAYVDGDWDESDVPVQDERSVTPMVTDAFVGLARDGSKALKEEFKANDSQRIKMSGR